MLNFNNLIRKQFHSELWIPFWLGILGFFAFTGGRILDFSYSDWMMVGDRAQHLLGWRFFRHTPFLQFPIGQNQGLGEILSSSIVFSDSIPLFAFPFKLIAWALPESFQYFGLWIALCFVLQGIFAWKILANFVDDRVVRSLATCFFILAPSMLWRLAGHEALLAHWVILAAIFLHLQSRPKTGKWIFLLSCTALIHAYLLAMVLAIWLLDWMTAWLRTSQPISWRRWLAEPLLVVGVLAILLWVIGYFSTAGIANPSDFSVYKLNLLSPIDGDKIWSNFLPDQPNAPGEFEGFNYFGLGLIGLSLVVVAEFFILKKRIEINLRVVVPLLLLSFGLTIYALSNHVSFGSREILSYSLSPIFNKLISTFRVSGRFFWIPVYLFYLSLFYFFVSFGKCRKQIWILVALLILQVVDISGAMRFYRGEFNKSWTQSLSSKFWTDVPKQYSRFAFVVPMASPPNYIPLALFASVNNMTINAADLARIDPIKLRASKRAEIRAVVTGQYDSKTIYVFLNDELWEKAQSDADEKNFFGLVDGYRIFAPGWTGCVTSCGLTPVAIKIVNQTTRLNIYQLGTRIDFSQRGHADSYLFGDWSTAETSHRWTDGTEAFVSMKVNDPGIKSLTMRLEANAFLSAAHPNQTVQVSANGKPIGKLYFTIADNHPKGIEKIVIEQSVLSDNNSLTIGFKIENLFSPKQAGMNGDERELGISVRSLIIEPGLD